MHADLHVHPVDAHNRDELVLTVHVDHHAAIGCYLRAGFQDTTLYHGGRAGPQTLKRRHLTTVHTHP